MSLYEDLKKWFGILERESKRKLIIFWTLDLRTCRGSSINAVRLLGGGEALWFVTSHGKGIGKYVEWRVGNLLRRMPLGYTTSSYKTSKPPCPWNYFNKSSTNNDKVLNLDSIKTKVCWKKREIHKNVSIFQSTAQLNNQQKKYEKKIV